MGVFNHPATVTETPRAAVLTGEPALVVRLRDVLDRLEALPPALRGLVQACAENRLDGDLLGFLADYLNEHGMEGGQRVRILRPAEGDVLCVWIALSDGWTDAEAADAREAAENLGRKIGLPVLLLRSSQFLATADPDQLRAAGWVRAEELTRYGEAVRERCARLAEALVRESTRVPAANLVSYVGVHLRAVPAGPNWDPSTAGG